MSILTDKLVEIDGVRYYYTIRMHNKVNKLASKFYSMHRYRTPADFDFSESTHPQERLMYSMALTAFIYNGKVKELK